MVTLEKPNIRELEADNVSKLLVKKGEKAFRAKQVQEWLWKKGARSFDEMSNLAQPLRNFLHENFALNALTVNLSQRSEDGTIKFRLQTFDGYFIESVLIPTDDRITACVSSQVGCSLTCKFCATGKLERERNLNFDEIFDQVMILRQMSIENFNRPLTNIVYMGMGEPLLNYENVMKSVEIITSPNGAGMSPRRITMSTAGIAKMIKKLGDDEVKFKLALSLHAPNDAKRNQIMPINETNNLKAIMSALDYFYKKTKNRISFEYIMFEGFNDTDTDAMELVELCKRVPAKVNLIEYNTVENVPFKKSSPERIQAFADLLYKNNVTATIRYSRGKDIDAACGQLANK